MHRFQDFYEEGEREILLDEVSKLRDQVLKEITKICFFNPILAVVYGQYNKLNTIFVFSCFNFLMDTLRTIAFQILV